MKIVYAKEKTPEILKKSIFLAGPTSRSREVRSWRPDALRYLKEAGYNGAVFVPEPRGGVWAEGYEDQVEWEEKHLHLADCILFWIPRELDTMPAFTTNIEWGVWCRSGKVILGTPPGAANVKYQRYYADKYNVPTADTLKETVHLAINMCGDGALRIGGEKEVPLHIWNTPHFQQWYSAQKNAGNWLDGARVEWAFRVGPKKNIVFLCVLHVNLYISSEKRNKTNEVVISRPDISAVCLFRKRENIFDSDIVLIREFRSPAATSDGFAWEIAGGSSFKPDEHPELLASEECVEETGLSIYPTRFRIHEKRQLVATLSSHKATLFSAEITEEELDFLLSQRGIAHGVIEDTERTYVEIMKLKDIMEQDQVDWSMLGMILSVIMKEVQ